MTIYSYRTRRLNWKYRQILAESKEMKINKKGSTCSNFISIEFEYQNSGYSHNSMGQVHLFFLYLFLIFTMDFIGLIENRNIW
jgi:hypothetical protein